MLLLVIASALTFLLFWKIFVGGRRERLINEIPGPKAYPVIGNFFDIHKTTDKILSNTLELVKKYGPIYRVWSGPIPIVVVSNAEHVETILSHNREIKKSFMYRLIAPWLGSGLLTSYNTRWTKHRKLITPTFHFKILDSFIPVYESNANVLLEKLAKKAETNEVFDIYPFITLCALDIICETAMGLNLHAQDNTANDYISGIYRISKLTMSRGTQVYLHPTFIYKHTKEGKEFFETVKALHDFTETVIRERKLSRKSSTDQVSHDGIKTRKTFLDLLLDVGSDWTDTDLREEVDTFMFAGHDTTTAGISWVLYMLGSHPEVQELVAEEINAVWPRGESLTMQALTEMKTLERVIKETMRIYPSVYNISRQLQNDLQFGEYLVPADTTVSISIKALHRDEKYFPNPEKFDPDRFLPENIINRHPFAYVPFSAGPRNCIGQKFAILEEKAIVASIVRAYQFKAVENDENIVPLAELIQRPKNGIKLTLSKRQF